MSRIFVLIHNCVTCAITLAILSLKRYVNVWPINSRNPYRSAKTKPWCASASSAANHLRVIGQVSGYVRPVNLGMNGVPGAATRQLDRRIRITGFVVFKDALHRELYRLSNVHIREFFADDMLLWHKPTSANILRTGNVPEANWTEGRLSEQRLHSRLVSASITKFAIKPHYIVVWHWRTTAYCS